VNDRVARANGAWTQVPWSGNRADETCCEIGSNKFFGAFPAALIGGNHDNVRSMLNCKPGRGLGIVQDSDGDAQVGTQ
jgi:hypothetical protein